MAREPVGGGNDERTTEIAVGGRTREITRALGEIDYDNLIRETQDIGGHVIWWGVLHARAMKEVGRAKLRADVVEAQTARALRHERTRNGEKVTDKIIDEETSLHRDVIAAKEALIDAEERANILKSVSFSLEQKNRLLTSLTGAIAREMGANSAPDDTLRAMQRGRMGSRRAVN
jgi:hypothetical protein